MARATASLLYGDKRIASKVRWRGWLQAASGSQRQHGGERAHTARDAGPLRSPQAPGEHATLSQSRHEVRIGRSPGPIRLKNDPLACKDPKQVVELMRALLATLPTPGARLLVLLLLLLLFLVLLVLLAFSGIHDLTVQSGLPPYSIRITDSMRQTSTYEAWEWREGSL